MRTINFSLNGNDDSSLQKQFQFRKKNKEIDDMQNDFPKVKRININ